MIIKIYPENPNSKAIDSVVDVLRGDGVIIYPTDSVYAFGCSLNSPKAIERMREIKGDNKKGFAIMCDSLSTVSEYTKLDNQAFKLLKRNTPGAFTFILTPSSKMPDKVLEKRRTIGVRIADNAVACSIVAALGVPLVTSSVRNLDQDVEYTTDPELIAEKYGAVVNLVVDAGYGETVPTTLVDTTEGEIQILRQGVAELII